ncbi:MAG: hypothetical protein Q9227_006311 [Pyrenula ochraceoflavens]
MKPFKRVRVERRNSEDSFTEPDLSTDVFKRFFEGQFQPLSRQSSGSLNGKGDASDDSESDDIDSTSLDWNGLSTDDEASPKVEIVEHREPRDQEENSRGNPQTASKLGTLPIIQEDEYDKLNLKNDLELQRLLKESHLLDGHDGITTPEGSKRQRAVDMRLQSLGAKKSILQQEKMPMAHRHGMQAKARAREKLRRSEALQNGITLERALPARKSLATKRNRGVGGPGIGKYSGGTLKLSEKDIQSLQGPKRVRGSRKRAGR